MRTLACVILATFGIGCGKGPSAMDVCKKLEASGIAEHCKKDEPGGIGVAAKERATFDLTHVAGESGQVLTFDSDDKFAATVKTFDGLGALAGPHRYGSKKARVFVQMNDKLSADDGAKARAIVADLGDLTAPSAEAAPKVASMAPSASPSAPADDDLSAMACCQRLAAAKAVPDCTATDSPKTVKFGQKGSPLSGLVSVYPEKRTFDTVSKAMMKEHEKSADGQVATSANAHAVVMWKSSDAAVDKKIRTAVDAL